MTWGIIQVEHTVIIKPPAYLVCQVTISCHPQPFQFLISGLPLLLLYHPRHVFSSPLHLKNFTFLLSIYLRKIWNKFIFMKKKAFSTYNKKKINYTIRIMYVFCFCFSIWHYLINSFLFPRIHRIHSIRNKPPSLLLFVVRNCIREFCLNDILWKNKITYIYLGTFQYIHLVFNLQTICDAITAWLNCCLLFFTFSSGFINWFTRC